MTLEQIMLTVHEEALLSRDFPYAAQRIEQLFEAWGNQCSQAENAGAIGTTVLDYPIPPTSYDPNP